MLADAISLSYKKCLSVSESQPYHCDGFSVTKMGSGECIKLKIDELEGSCLLSDCIVTHMDSSDLDFYE